MVFSRRIVKDKVRLVGRDPNDYAREVQDALNELIEGSDNGLPPGFGDETPTTITPDSSGDAGDQTTGWAAADHDHPIATDTASALGNSASEGTSDSFSRADHVHKRDVRVQSAGSDVGTRNAISFSAEFTVTDNGGSDRVDVSMGGPALADLEYLAWVM